MQRLALALAAIAPAIAVTSATARPHYINVRLVVDSASPRPGQTMLVGFQMVPRPGWHGYWSNPGESGLAPVVRWSAPAGVHFGQLQHPAPTLMQVSGMTSYVHAGPHTLVARVRLDRSLRVGQSLPITADLAWAACSDKLCVPEKARLTLLLKVGAGEPSPDAALLERAVAAEPKSLSPGTFSIVGARIILRVPPSARLDPQRVRFFPDENGYWNPAGARVISRKPMRIASPLTGKPGGRISGVLSDGSSAYRLNFERAAIAR